MIATWLAVTGFVVSIGSMLFTIGAYYSSIKWRFRIVSNRFRQMQKELDDVHQLQSQQMNRPVRSRYTAEDRLEP